MSQNVLDPDFLGTQVRWGKDGPQIVTHRLSVSVEEGPDRGATCDVEGSRLVIGTTTECDLVLRDPHVSRRHCEIVATDDGYKLRDLGSTNGTMIGAAFVTEAVLLPQAELRVGDTVIHFMPKRRWVTIMDSRASHFGGLFGTSPAMRICSTPAATCRSNCCR